MTTTTTRTLPVLILGLLTLSACPEPVEVPISPDGTPSTSAGGPGGPGAGGPAPDPGGNSPNSARWDVKAGEGIKLTGTFAYEGTKSGKYRLDFRTVPEGNAPPALVHTLELQKPGEWSARAPVDAGAIDIIAFIDVDGDGPTGGDPGGMTAEPVVIASEDIAGIEIAVSDDADESVMNPRARWRGGEGAPAPGDMPTPDGPPPEDGGPSTPEGGDPNAGSPEGSAPPAEGSAAPAEGSDPASAEGSGGASTEG